MLRNKIIHLSRVYGLKLKDSGEIEVKEVMYTSKYDDLSCGCIVTLYHSAGNDVYTCEGYYDIPNHDTVGKVEEVSIAGDECHRVVFLSESSATASRDHLCN